MPLFPRRPLRRGEKEHKAHGALRSLYEYKFCRLYAALCKIAQLLHYNGSAAERYHGARQRHGERSPAGGQRRASARGLHKAAAERRRTFAQKGL